MKIGKYEFSDKKTAESKIKSLGVETDEDGIEYPTHKHSIVKLGHIIIEKPVLDGQEVIKEAVFSPKYHIDVMWAGLEEHPYGWKSAAVTVEGQGVHSFYGIDYQQNKM